MESSTQDCSCFSEGPDLGQALQQTPRPRRVGQAEPVDGALGLGVCQHRESHSGEDVCRMEARPGLGGWGGLWPEDVGPPGSSCLVVCSYYLATGPLREKIFRSPDSQFADFRGINTPTVADCKLPM